VQVSDAATSGAIYYAGQRGATSPYTGTETQVNDSASQLTLSKLSIATTVNGTACTSDASCATALTTAMPTASTVSKATVTVTYAFTPIIGGTIFGLAAMMPSSLSNTVSERVQ
jgi:hypothetical protein